ncbi:MAG: extracellular solute-binding protein [Patescibacteria group bacterium]
MRRVLIILAILLLPAAPVVLVVTGVLKSKPQTVAAVKLSVWGTADNDLALRPLIAKYRQTRSYVTVTYTKVRAEDYAEQLISAWAQGTGPDVFFAPANWIGQMAQYAVPMPANLTVPQVLVSKGLFGTTTKVINNTKLAPSSAILRNSFIEAVTDDVIRDGQVWGLPLGMDTIVTYYNKDLTNNAKIFEPATTWSELQTQVTANRLTITDEQGRLVQSGVALGTANNLPYAADLLALLMLQNGSTMVTPDRQAHLNDDAGLQALRFFLSFAQPKKNNFSWDADQTNARDAFIQGKLGYFFGTLADRAAIEASAVNWGVAPMLHIRKSGDNDGQSGTERYIDAANYEVAMVSKASALSRRTTPAWNFIEYISQAGNVQPYLQATGRLPAIKSLLAQRQDDPTTGLYAKQLLTAKTWYRGNDGPAVEGYLQQLITAGLTEKNDLLELLNLVNKQVQSTL